MNKIVEFVLQRHDANVAGTHMDFRIQYPNDPKKSHLLASWAIPRAIVPSVGAKVLAVRTPDHGWHWLSFKGKIEKGYGAGTVKIIQRGKLEIELWTDSHIVFRSHGGSPIKGKYSLIKFGKVKNKNQEAWIILKHKDGE